MTPNALDGVVVTEDDVFEAVLHARGRPTVACSCRVCVCRIPRWPRVRLCPWCGIGQHDEQRRVRLKDGEAP